MVLDAIFPFKPIEGGVEKTNLALAALEPVEKGIAISKTPLDEVLFTIWGPFCVSMRTEWYEERVNKILEESE